MQNLHQPVDKTPQHHHYQSTPSHFMMQNVWSSKINGQHTDAVAESSNNFVSFAHPNRGNIFKFMLCKFFLNNIHIYSHRIT